MKHCDIVIVGAGLLGCFAARALAAYELNITVLEQREDVCTGISRANTGIVYTGGDTKSGTLKTRLCVRANESFHDLCRDLDVPFSRCGSLMLSFGSRADSVLQKKYQQGLENGVKGLEMLDAAETLRREPNLAPNVRAALYSPGTGTVDPWDLGIAAFENAAANGVDFRFGEKLLRMERTDTGFLLETDSGAYCCRAVVNCAGLKADAVREMLCTPMVRIFPSAADYIVLDNDLKGFLNHVIFHEPEEKGKGLTLVPTVDGNILVGPTEYDHAGADYATTGKGLATLRSLCGDVVPGLDLDRQIRTFGSLRPNPFYVSEEDGQWIPQGKNISSFTILEEEGLFSFIGIKTPGMTCAHVLGLHIAEKLSAYLGCDRLNPRFSPRREGIPRPREMSFEDRAALIAAQPDYAQVLCRCRQVTKGEVLEAIARGAVSIDGVKRRTGAGMGRCQGSYCMQSIMEILAEKSGKPVQSICKDGPGTPILKNGTF